MRSPGSSVQVSEMNSTSSDGPKMRSSVVESWRCSPLTHEPMRSPRGVRDLVDRRHPRAPRARGVEGLGARPLRLGALEVAGRGVVGHRPAGDAPAAAHDDHHLGLVVEPLGRRGALERPARRRARRRELHEHDRPLGRLLAGLARVGRVVEADAEDRPRLRHGCQQAHLGERERAAAGGREVARREAVAHGAGFEGDDLVAAHLAGLRVAAVGSYEGRQPHTAATLDGLPI